MAEIPPQSFAEYPREVDPRQYYGPPDFRVASIAEAWQMLKGDPTTWIVSVLILILCTVVVQGVGQVYTFVRAFGGNDLAAPRAVDVQVVSLISGILAAGLSCFLSGGIYRIALQRIRLQYEGVGGMFNTAGIGGRLFAWGILYALPTLILGAIFSTIMPSPKVDEANPFAGLGIAFGFLGILLFVAFLLFPFFLTPLFILDKKMGIVEAAGASWKVVSGKFGRALGFYLCASLASGIGALACGVGILVTAPLYYLSIAIVYRDHFIPPLAPQDLSPNAYMGYIPPYDVTGR